MEINNKKILKRGLILTTILVAMIFFLNYFIIFFSENKRFGTINHFNSLQENTIDILILGNSHAQEGLNQNALADKTNMNVFNFAFSQQNTGESYYYLKEAFKIQNP
ncbi:MAG: hypothetical protein KAQ68_09405, partial [Clostridiales bacterium]|nr:hypothetical protein [Clostridiales bacterium]